MFVIVISMASQQIELQNTFAVSHTYTATFILMMDGNECCVLALLIL